MDSQNHSSETSSKSVDVQANAAVNEDNITASQPVSSDAKASANDVQPAFDSSPEGRKEAKRILNETHKTFRRAQKKISPEIAASFQKASDTLRASLDSQQGVDLNALNIVNQIASTTLKPFKKSSAREVGESLLFALLFALVLRTFLVEPFKIPTRSMVPTLLEGDQLFVTKLSYGVRLPFLDRYVINFSKPQRGDVVVFAFPQKEAMRHIAETGSLCMRPEAIVGEKDYIKRIIGVEGDVIEVIGQVVTVNGEPIQATPYYEHTVLDKFFPGDRRQGYWNHNRHGNAEFTTMTHEIPQNHFGPITVKPGHIFVMGDNRDNSLDSRCWGQVPIDNIKGRAQILWWSGGANGPRWNRMFRKII